MKPATGMRRPVADANVAENLRQLHTRVDAILGHSGIAGLPDDGSATLLETVQKINEMLAALESAGLLRH